MTWKEAFNILEPLADADYIGGKWHPIRYAKCLALFELAQGVKDGNIVELGTFRGLGAIALSLGATQPVYTIDSYKQNTDSQGYAYTSNDQLRFWENRSKAGVNPRLIEGDARMEGHMTPRESVGLLFWDLGEKGRLVDDIKAWLPALRPDGLVAVKDLETGGFGREGLEALGLHLVKEYPEGAVYVYAMQQAGAEHVFWLVSGGKYVDEAIRSAQSVAKHMPQLQQAIYQPNQREHKEWFIESTRLLIQVLERLPDGAKCLWLDSDTFMLEPVPELFEMLDRFDMVLAHAPGHVTAKTVRPIPACFPESQIGVIVMNNTPEVQAVWRHTYRLQIDGVVTDQAALREAVWQNKDVRFSVMPCEYDFRFQFGGQVRDRVKIIHGHAESAEIYEAIGRAVNTGYQEGCQVPPRLWHPKHGLIT